MFCFKFDENKIKIAIDIYKEERGDYPYLIISAETAKYLPYENEYSSLCIIPSITSDHTKDIESNNIFKKTKWHNATILIDDNLKFGEVLVK